MSSARELLEEWLPPLERCAHLWRPAHSEGWWDARQCTSAPVLGERFCLAHMPFRTPLCALKARAALTEQIQASKDEAKQTNRRKGSEGADMTKETRHTPGPWTIEEYGDEDCPALVLHSDSETRICFMATPGSHGDPTVITANARLIATAPDMEAEMKRFLPVLERAEANPTIWAMLTAGLGIATANAYRAAIAKATKEP